MCLKSKRKKEKNFVVILVDQSKIEQQNMLSKIFKISF